MFKMPLAVLTDATHNLRNTILEIRQSLSLESTLTGLRTFLVTEKFLDMICILNSFLSLYCNLGYVILS